MSNFVITLMTRSSSSKSSYLAFLLTQDLYGLILVGKLLINFLIIKMVGQTLKLDSSLFRAWGKSQWIPCVSPNSILSGVDLWLAWFFHLCGDLFVDDCAQRNRYPHSSPCSWLLCRRLEFSLHLEPSHFLLWIKCYHQGILASASLLFWLPKPSMHNQVEACSWVLESTCQSLQVGILCDSSFFFLNFQEGH